jgi:hypothetical protein
VPPPFGVLLVPIEMVPEAGIEWGREWDRRGRGRDVIPGEEVGARARIVVELDEIGEVAQGVAAHAVPVGVDGPVERPHRMIRPGAETALEGVGSVEVAVEDVGRREAQLAAEPELDAVGAGEREAAVRVAAAVDDVGRDVAVDQDLDRHLRHLGHTRERGEPMSYVPVAFGSKANGGSLKNESRHEFCATLLPGDEGAYCEALRRLGAGRRSAWRWCRSSGPRSRG